MIHVIPVGTEEDRKHAPAIDCWCHPQVVEGATQPTYVHHAPDPNATVDEPEPPAQ